MAEFPEVAAATSPQHTMRARRQSPANACVRDVRGRLSPDGNHRPELQYDLMLIFVRNELAAVLTLPLLATIIALASMFWAPVDEALIWLTILLLARATLHGYCNRFANTPRKELDMGTWFSTILLVELLYGMSWAGIALVGLNSTDPSSHVFAFAAFVVVLTIRLLFASTVMPIVYAGTLPVTAALVARLSLAGDPFYWAMASMAIGLHIYFIFLAKGLNATVLAMLEFRAEKGSLIAELEQAKAISDEARRRAESANIAKSRFLATMSHELRTPLNAILGFSEVMKAELLGPLENKTYREYSDSIHSSGKHLLHLINEILDLSRIEAGRHELNEQPLELAHIADDCQRLMKLRADGKGITIAEDIADGLPPLWADERAIRQVCLNLLSNAIKFTPNGGTVTISVNQLENGDQRLSVKDNGPGISSEELPRVMEAFGQGSLAHENAEGGTGLGLPIVKSLVELHGGRFELKSELRRGTEAIVRLPRRRSLQPLRPLRDNPVEADTRLHASAGATGTTARPARAQALAG